MSSEQSSHNNEREEMNLTSHSGDIHICGTCKLNFSDLNMFMDHKRSQCLRPPPESNVHSQSLLELVTNNSTDDSLGLSLVGLHPLYRINMDGDNLTSHQETRLILQHLRSQGITGSVILRSHMLESTTEQPVEISIENHNPDSLMQDMISIRHQQVRRDFEMNEEDVASLLANQLANEVVGGVNMSSISSFGGELLSRASISQNNNTGSPEPANLFSSEDVGIQKEGVPDTQSDPDESFNSPLPPQEEFILPSEEIVQGNLDCQPDLTLPQDTSVIQSPSRLKKRHCCEIEGCRFTSLYLKDLARHMRKHTGERPFRCKLCSKTFSRADKLQVHQRMHAGIKGHTCTICPYATVEASSLRKHMLIHTDERPYKCQICSYRSRTSSHLTVHLRTHTGDCPFVCPTESCPAAFKTSSDLRRHARLHSGEKPYECEICGYACNIKSNLKIHIRLNHTQYTPVPCPTCNHIATSKRASREHIKLHAEEVLKCSSCPFTCTDREVMKTHLEKHSTKSVKEVSCKHCFFTCHHKKNLKRHLRSKHPHLHLRKIGKSNIQDVLHSKGSVHNNTQKVQSTLKPFCNKTYQCTICNLAFVREDSWRSHLRQHKGLGNKPRTHNKGPAELSARDLLDIAEKEESAREFLDINETAEATSHISSNDNNSFTYSNEVDTVINFQQLTSRSRKSTISQSVCFDGAKDSDGKLTSQDEVFDTDSSPPRSVYVCVSEGDDSGQLQLNTPVVFSSTFGQYVTVPGGGVQFMLSLPHEGLVSKEALDSNVPFSHKHTVIGSHSSMHNGISTNVIEEDITFHRNSSTPCEVHVTDKVTTRF